VSAYYPSQFWASAHRLVRGRAGPTEPSWRLEMVPSRMERGAKPSAKGAATGNTQVKEAKV